MEASTDDPRTKLDSHDNVGVLGSNSFVFESARRTWNVQPFTSDLDMISNFTLLIELYH